MENQTNKMDILFREGLINMLTSENFSPNNRSKTIGYSLYRISNTKPNGNGKWYICEVYHNGIEWSCYKAYHNNRKRDYKIDAVNVKMKGNIQEVLDNIPEINNIKDTQDNIQYRNIFQFLYCLYI